jgi:type III secretory pathway component EscT
VVGVGQLGDGAEDQAVVMPIEIAVRDLIQHAFPGVVVQHQATEHGLFGLDGMRRHLQGGGLQIVLLGRVISFMATKEFWGMKTKGTACKQDRARC